MRGSPSEPSYRRRFQTTSRCCSQSVDTGAAAVALVHDTGVYLTRTARQSQRREGANMQAVAIQAAPEDVRAFIQEYFDAWKGTDEHTILAYYSDDVVLHLPTGTLEGK